MEVDGSQSDWRNSIKKNLNQANEDDKSNIWTNIKIYRALQDYRKVNKACLEPKIVSLGPYHRSNRKLREADPHKWRALHYMLKRNEQEIDLYLDAMIDLEQEARSCYEGNISLSKEKFVEMMLLDGCFIIEVFHCMIDDNATMGYPDFDPFFKSSVFLTAIMSDILLLENQIPIFVLKKLGQLQHQPAYQVGFFPNRSIWMITNFMSPSSMTYNIEDDKKKGIDGNHILDIVWKSLSSNPNRDEKDEEEDKNEGADGDHILHIVSKNLSSNPDRDATLFKLKEIWVMFKAWIGHPDGDERKVDTLFSIPCASKLKESRLKFKPREGHPFWKVNFKDRTVQLTQLHLEDNSKTLFCNLIAYEQRHLCQDKFITGYMCFMSELIDSIEDVQYLMKCKIIYSMLGSYVDVVNLFDKITTNAMFDLKGSYLESIVKDINKHYYSPWYKWRAELIDTYFKNPWSTISLIAASFLLVFTFIQTFYTVKGYYSTGKK